MTLRAKNYPQGAFELKISSDPSHLAPARMAVERLCADAGFDPEDSESIGLAVNEALANVMRHAYGGANDKPIEVTAKLDGNGVEITGVTISIRDWGSGTNPCDLAPPPPNPLKPGGLGLICMRRMMDAVVFTPQPDGMLLTMRKNR